MKKVKSCGVLCLTKTQPSFFLLMKHSNRYDLPKGHLEPGETKIECAFRELFEETAIAKSQVFLEPNFRFETIYYPKYKRFGDREVEKTLIIFLGRIETKLNILCSEHPNYEWIEWNPPHNFQNKTVDSLLKEVEQFLK